LRDERRKHVEKGSNKEAGGGLSNRQVYRGAFCGLKHRQEAAFAAQFVHVSSCDLAITIAMPAHRSAAVRSPRPTGALRPALLRACCLLALALGQSAFAQSAAAPAEATSTVKTAVEGVLEAVRATPAARDGDLAAISKLVEEKFLPYTDFERTTRLAVGEAVWKDATPAQQQALFKEFQTLLVRTYATELTQISGSSVKFSYLTVQTNATNVVVPTRMATNGDDNEIDYRVEKGDHGPRIYDINIMGAWLVQLYKGQFQTQLSKGGIDALIKSLAAHNGHPA
jgi:ABC-type transporter MlaC component